MKTYTTSERLKEIMELKKLKQVDILEAAKPYAERYGIKLNKNDLSQYVSGKNEPGQRKLTILGLALNVSETWLMGYDVPMERTPPPALNIESDNIHMIPVFDSVSAGFGAYASNYIVDYAPAVIKSGAEDYIYINVKGDSMFPKIEEGDKILVRRQTSVDSGSIAVILIDGEEAVVKKVVYGDDWIELHSINPMYPVRRFNGQDVLRLSVLGLVKQVIKDI
ncbi:MAG: S24 family peptidase [Oscillospiraceae bacterium]